LGWDVLQERENSVVWVLVPEGVEDEALFGYECVSVSGNPVCYCRCDAPRIEIKLKPKKAIAEPTGTIMLAFSQPRNKLYYA
jgi:hypothetical protein